MHTCNEKCKDINKEARDLVVKIVKYMESEIKKTEHLSQQPEGAIFALAFAKLHASLLCSQLKDKKEASAAYAPLMELFVSLHQSYVHQNPIQDLEKTFEKSSTEETIEFKGVH